MDQVWALSHPIHTPPNKWVITILTKAKVVAFVVEVEGRVDLNTALLICVALNIALLVCAQP